MNNQKSFFQLIIAGTVVGIVIVLALYLIPWKNHQWGVWEIAPSSVVTVTGTAQVKAKTQVASFTAGASSVNENKDVALSDVEKTVTKIIESAKSFGIPPSDIKTQNASIYQDQEQYYEDGKQRFRPGVWRVNNSVEIILRDVDKATALSDLLSQSGATNVYGPNLSFDDTSSLEIGLLDEAIAKAREKAEKIAQGSGRTLGKTIAVSEGYNTSPIYPYAKMAEGMGGGGSGPIETGSGVVSKTVTVTFELK